MENLSGVQCTCGHQQAGRKAGRGRSLVLMTTISGLRLCSTDCFACWKGKGASCRRMDGAAARCSRPRFLFPSHCVPLAQSCWALCRKPPMQGYYATFSFIRQRWEEDRDAAAHDSADAVITSLSQSGPDNLLSARHDDGCRQNRERQLQIRRGMHPVCQAPQSRGARLPDSLELRRSTTASLEGCFGDVTNRHVEDLTTLDGGLDKYSQTPPPHQPSTPITSCAIAMYLHRLTDPWPLPRARSEPSSPSNYSLGAMLLETESGDQVVTAQRFQGQETARGEVSE
ncbi:hypothetical protein GGR57DRAFT_320200 [Xylariaceae sp. FL1272]|nr:hypothetical protein GGR57DRAFT_320200 [Xylariaceae sp. FL1272]